MSTITQVRDALSKASPEELKAILESGFDFPWKFEGQDYAVRRAKDLLVEKESRLVQTEFYCYPENGEKGRQRKGVMFRIEAVADDLSHRQMSFSEAGNVHVWPPFKAEMYAALTAARAGKMIGETGANTYFHHKVEILTPKKEVIPLEDFDFDAEPLFMLGLYGGDFKLRIVEK